MGSPLLSNDRVSFVVTKPFTSSGKTYAVGDDFPQEDARNIEVMVRARYVVPVVEDLNDRPKYWYKEVKLRSTLMEKLRRENVQLRMPQEPDSDDVVDIGRLTHPETTPPAEEIGERQARTDQEYPLEAPAQAAHAEQYDPSYHSVREVKEHLAQVHDPEERDRIKQAEEAGRGRKGILKA